MTVKVYKEETELEKNENLVNYIKENIKVEKAIKFIVDNAKTK